MSEVNQFFRVGVTLRMRGNARLRPLHGGVIHALIRSANAAGSPAGDSSYPHSMMIDVPERCRVELRAGEPYRFGYTLIDASEEAAASLHHHLIRGLQRVGASRRAYSPVPLLGNFDVAEVSDLVSGYVGLQRSLTPIAPEHVEREVEHASRLRRMTLHFTSPYRAMRADRTRTAGHEFVDGGCFEAGLFVQRLLRRLVMLELMPDASYDPWDAVRTLENRLIWLDLPYGGKARMKTLGGSVGRVVIDCHHPLVARALVRGQYARVGQSTSFGLGAYRIEELGRDPFACTRSISLLDLALDHPTADADRDLPAGELETARRQLAEGCYQPRQAFRVMIPKAEGGERALAIPAAIDIELQRIVLRGFEPAIDSLFEESSFAYRKELSRASAARRIDRAAKMGFRYALRADFKLFFDSIDHGLLRERLDACLDDVKLVTVLMRWVESGAPSPGVGLPTGAPLSRELANLFLDGFDEQIAATGAMLVRDADDFLVLYRKPEEAARVLQSTHALAEELELRLNETRTGRIDLRAPFRFLGLEFRFDGHWRFEREMPRELANLHRQTTPAQTEPTVRALPGESENPEPDEQGWLVIGPGVAQLKARDGRLFAVHSQDGDSPAVDPAIVRELVILGDATVQPDAMRLLIHNNIRTVFASDNARRLAVLTPTEVIEDPDAVQAQADAWHDSPWRLAIARQLISAKLWNHALLARTLQSGSDRTAADVLADLSTRTAAAESVESLLGLEGAGGAIWYRLFGKLLPAWMRFEGRVAPDADDPGNVLLNLAQSTPHSQICAAIRSAGMVPSIGVYHTRQPGHAALASDLQEPFRHLMDRAVLSAARMLRPTDITAATDGPCRTRIADSALRKVLTAIFHSFSIVCRTSEGSHAARSYLRWLHFTVRSLRGNLLDRSKPFVVFRHPADNEGVSG